MARRRFIWELLRRTGREFLDDDCLHLAAGIAYYSLFSLFPLLLGLIAVLGVVLEPAQVQAQVVDVTSEYLPGSSELVARSISETVARRGTLGILAVLGLLWSGSAIFAAVRRSINRAWDVSRQRPFFKQKLLEAGMMLGVGSLFLLSLAASAAVQLLDEVSGGLLRSSATRDVLLTGFSLASLFLVVALIYRYIPNTTVHWTDIWPAAALVALLFELGKRGFLWYLETQALQSYQLTYGPLTAVMVLLLWAYLSALVLLAGAELASEYGRLRGSGGRGRGDAETRGRGEGGGEWGSGGAGEGIAAAGSSKE